MPVKCVLPRLPSGTIILFEVCAADSKKQITILGIRKMRRIIALKDWILKYEDKEYAVKVPGDFIIDLYENGVIADPYFSDNSIAASAYLDKEAEYEVTFSLSEKTKSMTLVFEGVDTYSEIYVNGELAGKTENMFLRYAFDVSEMLVIGENSVRVRMLPVKRFIDDKYHGRGAFSTARLQVRKAQCHFGWDWAPDLCGYGIWLPVSLELSDGNYIEYDCCVPANDGTVKVVTDVCGDGEIEVEINGKSYGGFPVADGRNEFSVRVESPELWWPNGYGGQPLYSYVLRLTAHNEIKDERFGRFAFREIKVIENDIGKGEKGFGFAVNGKEIFSKGSNWVPCSNQTGAICDREYETLVRYAREAGYTMFRNWGGGIYEKEIFYDLCDESGILVWQDMMFSCQDAPEDVNIVERIIPEISYQLKRLRRHPSVGIICGGNEWTGNNPNKNEPVISLLKEFSERLVPELRFVPCSPFSSTGFDLEDTMEGDSHVSAFFSGFKTENFKDFRKYIDANCAQFYSECAVMGSCRLRSLKKFIPERALWPISDIMDFHFVRHPYDPIPDRTYAELERKQAEELFGAVTGIEDFAKKSMIAHGETMGAEIDYARAYEYCRGFLNWMYNDNWGCGTWAVVDKYMELKPAYYYQKRSFAPIVVRYVLRDGKWALYISNDSTQPYGGTLKYGVKKLDGTVISESSAFAKVKPAGAVKITDAPAFDGGDYAFAYLTDGTDKTLLLVKPYGEYQWSTDLDVRINDTGDGAEIVVKANQYARCVFIDCPEPVICDDNYFDMEKDEEKTVCIKGIKKENFNRISVKTFADEWNE